MSKICLLEKGGRTPTGILTYAQELYTTLMQIDKQNNYFNTFQEESGSCIKIPFARPGPGALIRDCIAVMRTLNNYDLDIVHGLGNWVPPFLKKAKTIVTIHDVIPYAQPVFSERTEIISRVFFKIVGPYIANKADAIIIG